MISSHVKISCLKTLLFCPFNYTKICWGMIETSSNLLRSSSAIFGNLRIMFRNVRKMFGNVRLALGTILDNLLKSSENRQKRRHQHVYIIKGTSHVSSWQELYLTRSLHSHVRYTVLNSSPTETHKNPPGVYRKPN